MMRVDIHVHSKYSKRPSQWILKKIGCPESFSEPAQIYQTARQRGMTHVTISDHNTIDGALEIAHLPGTFISEEVTTYFPESGCKIHVLTVNITEEQHREIQRARENIFDLARYLKDAGILSIVAHPLYAINDRLTMEHFERLLLLFENFELNGSRNQRENTCLQEVFSRLEARTMERMADKHDLDPLYAHCWLKSLWGGSDDHSSLNIARTHTCIEGIDSVRQLTAAADPIATRVSSEAATPFTLAHILYSIAYQFYRSKFNLDRYADKNTLMRFLDISLRSAEESSPGLFAKLYCLWQHRRERKMKAPVSDSLMAMLRYEACQVIQQDPSFFEESNQRTEDFADRERKWFSFVTRASNRVMLHFGNHLLDHLSGANVFNIFATIGSAGGLYTLLAPYFVAFSQFAKDRKFSDAVRQRFAPDRARAAARTDAGASSGGQAGSGQQAMNVAHFTDTFYEVNGVALTLQQHVQLALKNHIRYTLVTCHEDHHRTRQEGVRNFKPIGSYELPEYPELKVFYPPLLDMLEFCYDQQFNHIHTATPGPIGLAALAIAKILKIPVSGTYHTAIPQYAQVLTNDSTIEDLTWKYVLWYYDQLDQIYVPSQSTLEELAARGIKAEKIKVYPRGIDVDKFHPSKKNGILKKWFGIAEGSTFIYVGRVSKEKNLHLLAEAFRSVVQEYPDAHLVVVGDGPYRQQMQNHMQDLPCHFTGYLSGETLSEVYASADVFVFPSTTDTFGNVVLEAQASGLPVIVTDQGGPCENLLAGRTGLVVEGDSAGSLLAAMRQFARDPGLAGRMSALARRYVEERSFENAFLKTWQMFHQDHPALMAKAG
jgi:glycosyltransferase involved in cell wall biosynthesis